MPTFLLLLGPPLASAILALAVRRHRPWVPWTAALLSLVSCAAAIALCAAVTVGDPLVDGMLHLRADALSAMLALPVAFVSALAAWSAPGLRADGHGYEPFQLRRFTIFTSAFTFAMLVAVTTDNVGFMWIAIEATTITSAVLIPLHVTKASVEASWKYILLGSVGIALAFAGTVLAYFDFVQRSGPGEAALEWTTLLSASPAFHPDVIRLAFVFLLVGYGTKAALAPMHTWLPDAHAEAPAPVSAMMSGVLLAVAMYAILRWKAVVDRTIGAPLFTDQLLIGLGVLSLAIAALSLVVQRNYKRMLAYSSVEHSGLICLGLGLGPAGIFAASLHLVNHAVVKSMLFLLSGRILRRYGSAELASVTGLLARMPATGVLFAIGVLALVGLPPFGLFVSEFALLRAGFAIGRPWLMGVVLALLAVACIGFVAHLNRMLYGTPPAGVASGEETRWRLVPLALCIAALVVLGLVVPPPVASLLTQIADIVGP
jgi:hydrogenase-4 component F